MKIFHVMGCSCVGKSTLMTVAKDHFGERVGIVQVGKALRAKYGEAHFKGSGNPLNEEALSMYEELVDKEMKLGRAFILVDGQPRNGQVEPIKAMFPGIKKIYIMLYASVGSRRARLDKQFAVGSDAHILGLKRIDGDRIMHYEVLLDLLGEPVRKFCTEISGWKTQAVRYIDFIEKI